MDPEYPEVVETDPLATGSDDTQRSLRSSFGKRVSDYGYSQSPPLKQISNKSPDCSPSQTSSPSLKRKNSQRADLTQTRISDTFQAASHQGDRPSPQRKATPRKRTSSTSASPASSAAPIVSKLHDSLRPNLILVLIGLNPGIMTATMGHPYAHPSNGFWKILHTSGITPIQHPPQDHSLLPDLYGIGNTNICARPSRLGSELTKAELAEGAKILDEKMSKFRPEAACISGKGVWEAIWSFKTGKKTMPKDAFQYGWQDKHLWLGRIVDWKTGEVVWEGTRTFVAPSTSGLNAGMSPAEKEEAWRPIGEWMRRKREAQDGSGNKAVGRTVTAVKESEENLDASVSQRPM